MFAGRIEAHVLVPAATTVAATNGGGGPTTVTIGSTLVTIGDLCGLVQDALNAQRPSGWTVTLSNDANGTGKVTINCTGTWALTFTSVNLRTILGFTADITSRSSSITGTNTAKGIWLPDCPLQLDSPVSNAPTATDMRISRSPRGHAVGMIGNSYYRHRNLRWSHVARSRVFTEAVTVGNSLEQFLLDTQFARGHVWFAPLSRVSIWNHSGLLLGGASLPKWNFASIASVDELARRVSGEWDGYYEVRIPELMAVIE
jgi:hypothetical protein